MGVEISCTTLSRLRSLLTNLIGLAEVFLQSGQRLLEVHLLPAELVSLGLEHVLPLLLLVEALVVVVDVGPETNYPVFYKCCFTPLSLIQEPTLPKALALEWTKFSDTNKPVSCLQK